MAEVTVHTYTAGEDGLWVNSYLVETGDGVVVVDTNLLNADIAALRKPLLGVFVTHAYPDHLNGVAELLRERDVPVYATAGVAAAIREVAEAKRAQWGPVYGEQWPATTVYPSVDLGDGEQVELGGVRFTARELGPAESHADSVILAQTENAVPVAFIGDLAFHGTHPYTADGHTALWLATLDTLGRDLADIARLLPGHGSLARPKVFAEQRRYLMFYRELVRRLADGRPSLDEAASAELDRQLQTFLPNAPLAWMIRLGANAVAAELSNEPVAA